MQEFPLTKKDAAGEPPLTAREREILGWVAKGMTNREIAGELQNFRSDGEKSFEKYFAQAAFGKSCPINALRVGTGMDRYAEKITQGRL
ncbi:hypothetical protein HMSSN036_57270 [Paenibacillus macerans]|nr:hypothetical protein HMSSN036_57270 [Paenibacillus macerans]